MDNIELNVAATDRSQNELRSKTMDNIELNVAANEANIESDLFLDIELLSEAELAKVGGGQAIIFL